MTKYNNRSYRGLPPPPVIDLTVEQEFKIRRLKDLLPEADKDDIITLLIALQRQNFCLCNNISNLVKQWPNPPLITPEDP
ncbi:MAG: hypothetical protein Unbinned8622contig1003_30 [Prokaryotic dsDNA virus sp.]|nr:MAG: hypothetical protein Unbinned8622contig1003_30 [Prokaryotic dsDNA virus sp.]